jgi:hypothetical protein
MYQQTYFVDKRTGFFAGVLATCKLVMVTVSCVTTAFVVGLWYNRGVENRGED